MKIKFTVFGKPVGKGRPRFYRRGVRVGTYTPAKTRAYERALSYSSLKFAPEQPISCSLAVALKFFLPAPAKLKNKKAELEIMPVPNKPDIDNLIKSALDPLNGVFWTDDKLIASITATKFYSDNPRTEFEIQTYG